MKISKIAKILPIALAFTVCGAFANGADENPTSSVIYQLNLNDYLKISVDEASQTSETTFGTDYGSINITTPLISTFTVITNAKERNLILKGTCENSGSESAIKYVGEDSFNLVFTNNDNEPTDTAVQDAKAGTPDVEKNANAIAFPVTLEATRTSGPNLTVPIKATAWDATNDGIKYTVQNGVITLKYTVSQDNVLNTFNTQDMSGKYKATLTLSDLAI